MTSNITANTRVTGFYKGVEFTGKVIAVRNTSEQPAWDSTTMAAQGYPVFVAIKLDVAVNGINRIVANIQSVNSI